MAHNGFISIRIKGVPYGADKARGNLAAPERWKAAIREQTSTLPRIQEACILKVTFLLPSNKFPSDYPLGPDLDNLLKLFLDQLNETIFSEAKGKDSCIVSLVASKVRIDDDAESGALLEVLPVGVK